MPAAKQLTLAKSGRLLDPANSSPILREIDAICDEVAASMRLSISGALRIGMRLIHLHKETGDSDSPGGFRAALERVSDRVSVSTAYRWMNAAARVLADHMGVGTAEDLRLPAPGSAAWTKLEKLLTDHSQGMSLRRILIGSIAASDDARMDSLIAASEAGDDGADAILERVAKGELTLVQAIRAQAGAAATKDKTRHDPVYLDIDGATGQPVGLFPKCLVTLANTFRQWDHLNESARLSARKSWKELVAHLPKELR